MKSDFLKLGMGRGWIVLPTILLFHYGGEVHFYGARAERLGVYRLQYFGNGSNYTTLYCEQATLNLFSGVSGWGW